MMIVSLEHPHARRFATIFRRECVRTALATPGAPRDPFVSLAEAAFMEVDGYDEWASAAFGRYVSQQARYPTVLEQAALASALSRSPLCEVMFAEIQLAQGRLPYEVSEGYDYAASEYRYVRPWPKARGQSPLTLKKMLAKAAKQTLHTRHAKPGQRFDPVGLLLVDQPWVVPADVMSDPVYQVTDNMPYFEAAKVRGLSRQVRPEIPMAHFTKTELDFDLDGLRKRMDHEMLVVEAAFDEAAARKLNA